MKLLTALSMAFGMFCALPLPAPLRRWDSSLRGGMLACFPWVGAFIGAVWALSAQVLGRFGVKGALSAALLTAVPLLLTGFIHLDGFMDCCDAIYSRRDLETRKKILKDSHCGAFAVIHLGLYLLLFFAAAHDLGDRPWVLLFLPVAPRCVTALAIGLLPPMQTSQYAGEKSCSAFHIVLLSATLILSMLIPPLCFGLRGLSAAVGAAVAAVQVRFGVKQLGGMSGDISGFAITRGELWAVLALSLIVQLEGGVLS